MNWNSIVAWTVSLSALSLLVRLMQRPKEEDQRGWLVVCVGILGITLALARLNAPGLGWVSGLLWLLFMAIPLAGLRLVMHWVASYRLAWAQRLAIALVVLHPADGWSDHISLLRVLRLAQSGQRDAATQLLQSMEKRDHPRLAYLARALFYATLADWAPLRTWVTALPPRLLEHNPHLALLYLRSLAELGETDHCLTEGQRLLPALERHGGSAQANYARMLMLAIGGQPDPLRSLNERASTLPPVERPFWIATAQWTAGQTAIAQATLDRLAADPTTPYSLKQAITWRKAHPLPRYTLAPDIRDRLLTDLHHSHYYTLSLGNLRHSRATLGLIALNLAVFALEIWAGGSTNLSTLYQLGALVPQAVANGAGWRLLSSLFLHYGWLHLTMNMTGLAILGPFVETRLWISRFLLIYFATGVGSMGCVTLAALLQPHTSPQIAVGASGAIMGLLGAVLAIFWEGWQVQRSRLARQRFYWLLLGVGIQITFDLSTPGISVLGHLSGFVLGSILGWLLVRSPHPLAKE